MITIPAGWFILAEFKNAMQGKYGYWNTRDIYMMKYWGSLEKNLTLAVCKMLDGIFIHFIEP